MREAVKERAGHKCEECGIEEGTVLTSRHTGKKYILYLHAAHLDGDPGAQEPRLLALCPSCHMRMDRQEEAQERPTCRRRGYSLTTTDKLVSSMAVAGLDIIERPQGYDWFVDGLEGHATSAINAVADAIYHLRQAGR